MQSRITTTNSSSSISSAPASPSPSLRNQPKNTLHTTLIVNQLVIRARLNPTTPSYHHVPSQPNTTHSTHPSLASSQGLQLVMCIKVSIPYSIIPPPGSPDLNLPLMPDHHLRLTNSTVLPLSRRSPQSKPIIQASNQFASQAHLAASALNLSKSFRLQNPKLTKKPPAISVAVRNFTISLVVSPSFLPSPIPSTGLDPRSPTAEYAIVLECLSRWTTTGPDWPFSAILPTPPCLKNSFRLLLPTDSVEDVQSSALHLNTFPPLRRERSRFSTLSNTTFGGTQSSVFSDDDLRPLSDESEPEGISSLLDDDDEPNQHPCINWPQDERSPRIEGVFQSTQELCLILGSDSQLLTSPLENPIRAKRASSRLSLSIRRPPAQTYTQQHTLSIDLNFHLELEQVSTQSTNRKTPLTIVIPHLVANQIISARWSPLNAEGVIQATFPPPLLEKEITSSHSLIITDQFSPSSSPSSTDLAFVPNMDATKHELELLDTAAPFSDLGSEDRAEFTPDVADLDQKIDEIVQPDKPEFVIPYQIVAWFDTEWLIRTTATSHNQSNGRLVLNLHAQLDLAISPCSPVRDGPTNPFPIPFFILPSVDEQTCACQISTSPNDSSSRQELELDLPSWASSLGSSSDLLLHKIQFCLNSSSHTATMDSAIMARIHPLESTQTHGAEVTTPERKNAQILTDMRSSLAESNVFIGTLVVSPAGHIRHHSRIRGHRHRLTCSNLSFARKHPRDSISLKTKSSKKIHRGDETKNIGSMTPLSKITASIRSVQLDLLIASPFLESPLVQYGELGITLSRTIEMIADPWVSVTFRTAPDTMVEILGAWIGDKELIQHEGFEFSKQLEQNNETGEVLSLVVVKLNVPEICIAGKLESYHSLPILRTIFKSQTPRTEPWSATENTKQTEGENFLCLLPSFDSTVGTYKVTLQTCATNQLFIDRSNMVILEKSSNVTELVQYSSPPHTINETYASIKPKASLSRFKPLKQSSSAEPLHVRPTGRQHPENRNHLDDRDTPHGQMGILSWSEYYTLKWGFNFKTLILCWLIYLVSFMSIQLDEMGTRLDAINQRQSQQLQIQCSKFQLPYQVADPGVTLKEDANDSKDEFGNTVKPFLSRMMANTIKPSSLNYKDFLTGDDDENHMTNPDQVLKKERKEETGTQTNQIQDSQDTQFGAFSHFKKSEIESEPPSLTDRDHPHQTSNLPPSGELNRGHYFLGFIHRLLARSILDPVSRLMKKIYWFNSDQLVMKNHDQF